jgi:hypothetical protein
MEPAIGMVMRKPLVADREPRIRAWRPTIPTIRPWKYRLASGELLWPHDYFTFTQQIGLNGLGSKVLLVDFCIDYADLGYASCPGMLRWMCA